MRAGPRVFAYVCQAPARRPGASDLETLLDLAQLEPRHREIGL